jgi:hypothetical protein
MADSARTHLFISYAVEDALFVDWLCLRLLNEGYQVWCDRLKLLGGESYPSDIDEAISQSAFRFIAVLSRSSIKKTNPVKERTAALSIARERKENFVIPLNLGGLAASELGWMQSDLTYIAFTNWKQGFTQLLKNLESAGTPKAQSSTSVASLLQTTQCVSDSLEVLWSNLVPIKHIPSLLYRYEHDIAMTAAAGLRAIEAWPHYRENASICWSFQPPPVDLTTEYKFVLRGKCADWRDASGPDINFYNIGKKVINSTLFHSLLAAGLRYDPENHYVYIPSEQRFQRLTFNAPTGDSWIKAVGLRSFWTVGGRESVRYHLSPTMKVWLDFGRHDVVCVRTRLYLTRLDGTPVKPAAMQSRRKVICRSWWNHEWLSRVFATLQLIAQSTGDICIGALPDEQLVLERFPMSLNADRALHEAMLKSLEEAHEFTELMDRHQSDESEILIDEDEKTGQTDAPSA